MNKMKRINTFLVISVVFFVNIMPASAALKKVAQTGLQFLKVDMSARAAAMAGAFDMVGDDANAVFYNPAGIARSSSSLDFVASRTGWIADINYNALGLIKNLDKWGSIGFSLISCDYGKIIGTRVASTEAGFIETGELAVGAYAVGLTYARALTDKFTVGAQIKYASQQLGENLLGDGSTVDNNVSGLAYDFGTIFYPGFKSLRVGMSIRNFSAQFKFHEAAFELPLTFKMGAAIDIFDLIQASKGVHSLLVALDAIHPRDYTERIHIGSEYWYKNMVAIRAGYKFNYDEESLSAGFGIKYNVAGFDIKFDYAFADLGVFNAVHRLSLGTSF